VGRGGAVLCLKEILMGVGSGKRGVWPNSRKCPYCERLSKQEPKFIFQHQQVSKFPEKSEEIIKTYQLHFFNQQTHIPPKIFIIKDTRK
jgi:hypothetical protein